MFKTYEQSYEIYFPNSTNKVMGFGLAPVVPLEWTGILTHHEHNKTITVFEFKTEVQHDDGTLCVYYRKPTMQWIMDRKWATGEYSRFYEDGTVEHGIDGEYYRWGPDIFTLMPDYYEKCDCRDCLGDYDTTCGEELTDEERAYDELKFLKRQLRKDPSNVAIREQIEELEMYIYEKY